jgi:hypothetical protein
MAPTAKILAIVVGAAAAKPDKDAKMAAVNKVITMLEDLQAQVLKEGEEEAASYNKFACFCKDTTKEKTESINKGEDDDQRLSTSIEDKNSHRNDLDDDIKDLEEEIASEEADMKAATKEREETNAVFLKNAGDLQAALEGLAGAIQVLKASKPSLVQLAEARKTVKGVTELADAMGLGSNQHVVTAFLQQDPSVPMENYKFKSDGIIGTLEELQNDFRKTKNEVDEDEAQSVHEYDMLMQEKTDLVKRHNQDLDEARKEKAKTTEEVGAASEELSTTRAQLLDDKQYLSELSEMCVNTAKTWDVRSKVRADELSALTAATTIVKETVAEKTSKATVRLTQMGVRVNMVKQMVQDPEAMESIEAEAEAAEKPVAFLQKFLQKSKVSPHSLDSAREYVINMLTSQGVKSKSTLLSQLAVQIRADPFAKIKKLIQDTIERLLHEAAEEANQKGWCDKAQADAKQKRTYAAEEIEALNGEMASLEGRRNKLAEELEVLRTEIPDLKEKRDEADKMREEEKAENERTVEEATAGLEAINMAIDILDKFYKTAAKSKVDLSLAQGPADEAPGAGFEIGEAYTGAGGESGGILGMMDVIKSDFERTISETEKAEKKATTDHRNFMTETGKSLAEKTMAEEQKDDQHANTVEELDSAKDSLTAEASILSTSIQELIELKPTCIDTGMSYEERVARREDEIESLKKALCIFENFADGGFEDAC